MVRIAIVEDEDIYIKQLTEYMKRYQQESGEEINVTVYRDGDGIISKYKAQFDIILMDIQMKFMDGMTAAEEIRKTDSEVIINQRIIAGNAQFTGIAAGRGVGFTTGLLLLREGLGMRETPIRPHSWH